MLRLRSRSPVLLLAGVLAVALTACAEAAQTGGAGAAGAAAASDTTQAVDITGTISLEPASGPEGTQVRVTGQGLPASQELELHWSTASGRWLLEGKRNEEYHGREYTVGSTTLSTVTTDADGGLETTFEVPSGYGFAHDVTLVDSSGVVKNKALFDVEPQVTITPTEGPVGTPITIEVRGMGFQTLENARTLIYDSSYVGFLSAVTTKGYAKAVIPAVGAPGPHKIRVLRGAYTFPYLNPQQSPRPDIPEFEETFTVTAGEAVSVPPIDEQNPKAVERTDDGAAGDGPVLTTDLSSGPVETSVELIGQGFDPGASVDLVWYRVVGNRVSGQGWDEQSLPLTQTTVSGDGSFSAPVEVPHDVGGAHRIEAVVNGDAVSTTEFSITPAADPLTPESGPWGTEMKINLTGVGWTETANIYTVVYDNSYIGYSCGFNSQGDVEITLPATGEPGWHYVDLYPAIYKGDETPGQQHFRIPQLTYAQDHPGEDLPAFHFAFHLDG